MKLREVEGCCWICGKGGKWRIWLRKNPFEELKVCLDFAEK